MTGVATGTVSSNVTNTINQIPESSPVDALGIKQLLKELQAAIFLSMFVEIDRYVRYIH